jgi:ATP-dependent exoDNAse (exonuclease V) beta subunit
VALVFAQLGERRLRGGIAALVDRRLVAPGVLRRFLAAGPKDLTAEVACRNATDRLRDVFAAVPYGWEALLADGPCRRPQFTMLADDIRALATSRPPGLDGREGQAAFRNVIDRLKAYFLTQDGDPRGKNFAGTGFKSEDCDTDDAWKRHRQAAAAIAPAVADAIRGFRRDLNVVMSRGVWRIFAVALGQYERTLESHALLDFPGVLARAVKLLQDLDEFAESRLRLEARYRHVLLDEFQDTSRVQWELVRQLVRTWGEGLGAADDAIQPSIFIVGDRKQSIYGFRDADVALVDDAAVFIEELRPGAAARQAITVSFRSRPEILAFVNDVFATIARTGEARRDAFRYDDRDRFPTVDPPVFTSAIDGDGPRLGVVVGATVQEAAGRVADEIVSLLSGTTVRDRATGIARPAVPADVAILFRSRDSHREFESALAQRGVSTYVYKGLGFFESDEVQDVVALARFLADPLSDLRASAFLRSRLVRLSDPAVAKLGPRVAEAIAGEAVPSVAASFDDEDRRVFDLLRSALPRWLARVDRETPSEIVDAILRETAYQYELRGFRRPQARENLKKLRSMIRRAENRGYTTLSRLADHLEQLAVGDESNAAIDAVDAVSLMTVHAAKGLEFPIVFVVNMGRGTGGVRPAIRVSGEAPGEESVAIADYQSEADEDASARDKEETKRLLYVALTRARDRLYLSASVPDGKFRAGRGSLADVLPDEVRGLFAKAAAGEDTSWRGPSGQRHQIVQPDASAEPRRLTPSLSGVQFLDDFGPLG